MRSLCKYLLNEVDYIRVMAKPSSNPSADALASLSPREMEIFGYLVNGLRAKDIAHLLEISPKTLGTYRASLMQKLNVHDLVGLVKLALERMGDEGIAGVPCGGGPRLPHRPSRSAAAQPPEDPFYKIE
jgi:DNA-binding NarL/FixJ family response regulator